MGYQVLTYNIAIGDPGVYQQDDGSGGTIVDLAVVLVPPTGWGILNVVPPLYVAYTPPSYCNVAPPSEDWTAAWTVAAGADAVGTLYPLDDTTVVCTINAIAAEA